VGERTDAMPTIGVYRDTDLHDFQSAERIDRVVKPEIDRVMETTNPAALLEMAGDCSLAPEARLTAATRYEAAYELAADDHGHTRAGFQLELVRARVAGLDTLMWTSLTCYGSDLDTPRAPGDDRPGPALRPQQQRERLCGAQEDEARR
jgi:hypothetical protein